MIRRKSFSLSLVPFLHPSFACHPPPPPPSVLLLFLLLLPPRLSFPGPFPRRRRQKEEEEEEEEEEEPLLIRLSRHSSHIRKAER